MKIPGNLKFPVANNGKFEISNTINTENFTIYTINLTCFCQTFDTPSKFPVSSENLKSLVFLINL